MGQEFLLNRELARIVGVVKDVSVTAKDAYAQVWGMYSADELKITGVHSYLGGMQIAVLARTSDDFPAIREGIAKQVERVNAGLGNKQIDIMEQPDNIVAHVNHVWANVGPDLTMLYLQYAVALFIILLVPSLNPVSYTHLFLLQGLLFFVEVVVSAVIRQSLGGEFADGRQLIQ